MPADDRIDKELFFPALTLNESTSSLSATTVFIVPVVYIGTESMP